MTNSIVPGALYVDLPGPDVRADLDAQRTKAESLLQVLERHEIDSSQAADQLGLVLKGAHEQLQALEKQRKAVKAPALLATNEIDAFFRPTTAALKKVKAKAGALVGDWTRKQDEARRAAMAEVAAGTAPVTAIAPPTAAPKGVAYRDEIKIEITDLDLLPREYMSADWGALNALAKAGGKAPPGCAFTRVSKPIVGR